MTSSTSFKSLNRKSLPGQGICKPECIVLPLLLIGAIPVGASNKTVSFAR